MRIAPRGVHVLCPSCNWQGQRVAHDPTDPSVEVGGFGSCPDCGVWLKRGTVLADRRAEKAKAEIAAMEQGSD